MRKRLRIESETIRTLGTLELGAAAGGISSDCVSRIYQCAVPTSKQPWCDATLTGYECPKR